MQQDKTSNFTFFQWNQFGPSAGLTAGLGSVRVTTISAICECTVVGVEWGGVSLTTLCLNNYVCWFVGMSFYWRGYYLTILFVNALCGKGVGVGDGGGGGGGVGVVVGGWGGVGGGWGVGVGGGNAWCMINKLIYFLMLPGFLYDGLIFSLLSFWNK